MAIKTRYFFLFLEKTITKILTHMYRLIKQKKASENERIPPAKKIQFLFFVMLILSEINSNPAVVPITPGSSKIPHIL